jgi:putative membrane protein
MSSGTAPVTDSSFVRQAAVSDIYEIQASQLAQTKATSADVKSFASRMIADHTKTSDQLKSIVSSKSGLTVPKMLDARHKTLLSRLRSASGASFDSLYAQQQLQAHQQAVMLFTAESQNGKDADLKRFATDTLPTLQQHLSMAQQLPKGGARP